jgi:hypothetical protein
MQPVSAQRPKFVAEPVRAGQRASRTFRLEPAEREMACWLARPSQAEVWDVVSRAGCVQPERIKGAGGHPRSGEQAHSLRRSPPRVSGVLTRVVPVVKDMSFNPV